jgi:hypothetical protein
MTDKIDARQPPKFTANAPVFNTQIINFPIDKHLEIWKPRSKPGKTWSAFLDAVEKSPGFQRLYWGKVVDIELLQNMTQLHIGMSIHTLVLNEGRRVLPEAK